MGEQTVSFQDREKVMVMGATNAKLDDLRMPGMDKNGDIANQCAPQ